MLKHHLYFINLSITVSNYESIHVIFSSHEVTTYADVSSLVLNNLLVEPVFNSVYFIMDMLHLIPLGLHIIIICE